MPFRKRENGSSTSQNRPIKCTQAKGAMNPKKKNKTSSNEKEFKCLHISFMYNHTLHGMTYCIKCILSKTGIKRKGP